MSLIPDPISEAEQEAEKVLGVFFRLLTALMRDTMAEIRKTRITIDIGDKPQ